MALWTLVGISTQVEVTSGAIALSEPAGCQAGDILVACISYRSNAAFTTPSGWSNAASQNTGNTTVNANGSIASARMDYKVRGAGAESGVSWARTGGDLARGAILAYRPTNGVAVFDQATSNTLATQSATVTSGTMTTVEDGELLVMLGAGASNVTWSAQANATTPATWTEHTDAGSTNAADGSLMVASAVQAVKGATGQFSATASATRRHAMIVGAFRVQYSMNAQQGTYAVTGQSTIDPGPVIEQLGNPYNEDTILSGTSLNRNLGAEAFDRYILVTVGGASETGFSITNWCELLIDDVPMTRLSSAIDTFLATATFGIPWPTGSSGFFDFNILDSAAEGIQLRFHRITNAYAEGLAVFNDTGPTSNVTTGTFDVAEKFSQSLHWLVGPAYTTNSANRITWTGAVEITETSPDLAGYRPQFTTAKQLQMDGTGITVQATNNASNILDDGTLLTTLVFPPPFSGVFAARGTYSVSGQRTSTPGVQATFISTEQIAFDQSDDTEEFIIVNFGPASEDNMGMMSILSFLASDSSIDLLSVTGDGQPFTLAGKTAEDFGDGIVMYTAWAYIIGAPSDTMDLVLTWNQDTGDTNVATMLGIWNVTGFDEANPVADTASQRASIGEVDVAVDAVPLGMILAGTLGQGYASGAVTQTFTGVSEDTDSEWAQTVNAYGSQGTYTGSAGYTITSTDDNGGAGQLPYKVLHAIVINAGQQGLEINADAGDYFITGQAALFPRTRLLVAAQGSYTINGQEVTFLYNLPILVADRGMYTVTGQDVGLRYNHLFADFGNYEVLGQAVILNKGITMMVGHGTYAVIGLDVNFSIRGRNEWGEEGNVVETWTEQAAVSDTWMIEPPLSTTWTEEPL